MVALLKRSESQPTLKALIKHIRGQYQKLIWTYINVAVKSVFRRLPLSRGLYFRALGARKLADKAHLGTSANFRWRLGAEKWNSLLNAMASAGTLGAQGHYRKAVKIQLDAVATAYDYVGLDHLQHFPQALPPWYSANIGHLGVAGAIAVANENGQVPWCKRIQLISDVANDEALKALSTSFEQLRVNNTNNRLEEIMTRDQEPALWPFLERLNTIRISTGLEDLYPFLERLGRDSPVERDNSPFKVSEEYKAWAEENLRVLGVLPTDHIVALHIREGPSNGDPRDHRLPDPQSFGPAINYLVQNGVKVVRYGSSHHTPLPPTDGLIDLPAQYPGRNSLDFAVIHKSLFMISTLSGPQLLANWMGVPTLITNTPSLGRNTLSGVKANRYLPQRFLDETGKILSLSQTLASPLAYWEGLHSREIPADPPTLKSSSSDILNATVEMLDLVSGATDPFISLHKKADEIRRESDAISYGKFSGTFLSANEDWIS